MIAFERHRLIDAKLCQLIFIMLKFYAINCFVKYIWDYSSTINYNIAHRKAAHKFFFQTFYNKTNKKSTAYKFDSITYIIEI